MQQEEIARLRKNTKKIREKASTEQAEHGQERVENLKAGEQDAVEQPKVSGAINNERRKQVENWKMPRPSCVAGWFKRELHLKATFFLSFSSIS